MAGEIFFGASLLPPGGIIDSLYISGSPIPGATLGYLTDGGIETMAFIGGYSLLAVHYLYSVSSNRFYGIFGLSTIPSVDLGAGVNLVEANPIGIRLQYMTFLGQGGTILGSGSAGPFMVGFTGLFLTYKF